MSAPTFTPVKPISEGGEGIPLPFYAGRYKDDTIMVWGKGEAREAVNWLSTKDTDHAIYLVLIGEEREERLLDRGKLLPSPRP